MSLPDSVRQGQRLTGMTAYQTTFPTAPSVFKFAQHGQSGMWLSELLPHTAKIADDLVLHPVDAHRGDQSRSRPSRSSRPASNSPAGPSIGSWIAYGLGSENQDLPAFVVMVSQGTGNAQALADRAWGSGFLPTKYQGVKFRSGADPVLYLSNPSGYSRDARRRYLDDLAQAERDECEGVSGPGNLRRASLSMRWRSGCKRPYPNSRTSRRSRRRPSSCTDPIRASRDRTPRTAFWRGGWRSAACDSSSSSIAGGISTTTCRGRSRPQCQQTDQPSAALIQDLKQRGMLDDTLVIWGGEFGRTVYSQGTLTEDNYGRDHHPRCFSLWMAGGGMKRGVTLWRNRRVQLQHHRESGRRA